MDKYHVTNPPTLLKSAVLGGKKEKPIKPQPQMKLPLWQSPETAPLDGTLILADFGWPWPTPAVFDPYDEQWCVTTVHACPMEGGRKNFYFEMDTENKASLKQWLPMPELPKKD